MNQIRMRTLIVSILAVLLLSATGAMAQPAPGAYGLRANIQDADTGISLPIWMSGGKMVFEPAVSFVSVSDSGTDLGFGATLRFNLRQERVTPYFGVRALGYFFSPDNGDGTTDFLFGPVFGGEFFLDEGFSLSVESQLNVTVSDEASGRFGNPDGTTISTGTGASSESRWVSPEKSQASMMRRPPCPSCTA